MRDDPDINLAMIKLRIANAIGIDTSGILLTEEQKQQKMAQQSMQMGMDNGAAALAQGMAAQATASPEAMVAAADSVGLQPGI